MTIEGVTILYCALIPESELVEYFEATEPWAETEHKNNPESWIRNEFIPYYHRDDEKDPRFRQVYTLNVPHDQVKKIIDEYEVNPETHYAIGIFLLETDEFFRIDLGDLKFDIEDIEKKHLELLTRFEGTNLYEYFKKARVRVIQDDCACCS